MGIILLLIVSLMWSFVGILVKSASLVVDSPTITLSRFLFGVLFLAALLLIRDKKLSVQWKSKWIWIAVIGKCCNYMFENLAISIGYAYGNILVMPLSTLFLVLLSVFYLKEKIQRKGWVAAFLCIIGVFLVSWNGLPLSLFLESSILTTLLFTFSAVGVTFHVLGQKMLVQSMDSGNMNFSIFFWSMLLTSIPVPFTFEWKGSFNPWVLVSLITLGLITGISFYLYANALKKVPFLAAVIFGNSSVLLSLLWAWLFFNEPITPYIVLGAVLFLIGIILLNLPTGYFRRKKVPQ